ncbi:MAG TPA: hypothetical protein VG244_00285 [Acidimicrobiales bacterium]|jgi:hypothetical protein|nr:hypothetical protein [Acidimicrobiales bacterium]
MALADQPARWRVTRLASGVVTVGAVTALAAFAVSGGGTVTVRTTVTKHTTVVKEKSVAATPASTPVSSAATSPFLVAPTDPVTSAATALVPGVTTPPATATASAALAPVTTAATAPSAPSVPGGTGTASDLPSCPYPLAAPADPGGLQSLIPFAPLFGPFSSEAFALAPLFQPFLQTVGPFLVAFANAYGAVAPALAPLVTQLENFENEGFNLLSPLYTADRSKFLAAESQLANALAPLATALAINPPTSCLVDVEALLTEAGGS